MNKFAHRSSRSVVLTINPTLCEYKNGACCLSDSLLRTAQSLATTDMKETGSMTIDTVRGPTRTHQARCTTVDGKKGRCTEQDATPVDAHGMNERCYIVGFALILRYTLRAKYSAGKSHWKVASCNPSGSCTDHMGVTAVPLTPTHCHDFCCLHQARSMLWTRAYGAPWRPNVRRGMD